MNEATQAKATAEKNPANEVREKIAEFLGRADVEISLTFPPEMFPEPIFIPCRIALTDDESAARIKFYSQPAEAQNEGRQKYVAAFMAGVLSGKPKGVPFFDALAEAAGVSDLAGWKMLFEEYLLTPGDKAVLLGESAVEQFNKVTKPVEFFR